MNKTFRQSEKALATANSYAEWYEAAQELDRHEGRDKWREERVSDDYDYRLLTSRVSVLKKLRRNRDVDRTIFRLREELHGNLGNMANPALYQHARSGTKNLINEYLDQVSTCLQLLCESDSEALPPMRKRRFLKRAARSFGRSCLLLSGGASQGLFHLGVIKELESEGIMPRVITGSSAGAVIAGIVACHTDAELEEMLVPDRMEFEWCRMFGITDMIKGSGVLDQSLLKKSIHRNIPEMTFLEAYTYTNRILNITVSPAEPNQFPRLLNYLTAPNVLIRRAALASAAIPGLFPPVQLRAKNFNGKSVAYMPQSRWIDGSVHEDIPKERVNRLHNVNHYIVSQTNPHVLPFLNDNMDEKGLLPFVQDVLIKGPMVQVEHFLEVVHQHFEVPGLSSIIKKAHAVARQTYSGDITIHPERRLVNLGKTFSNFGQEEIGKIFLEGRRATWPKIERIRNTTQISRTFDNCLRNMSERYRYVER